MPFAQECLSTTPPQQNIYAAVLKQAQDRREQAQQHLADQIARIEAKQRLHQHADR